ncbi:MAG: SDR family oxidoreductase [Lautropia sp.]
MSTPTVLITGAGSGIGRAAANRFAADGWRCVLIDRDADALARVHLELPSTRGGADTRTPDGRERSHATRRIDLADAAQVATLADIDGPIDAIVNNAGMSDPSGLPLVEQDGARQAALAALNLAAPAAVVTALESRLAAGARVVNVSSGAGLRAIPWRGYYSATKAGLIAQSRALALARPDLVVTVLCPGFVRTELVDALIAAGRLDAGQALEKTPLGRMAEPAEMAELLRFLASPDAEVIRGEAVSLCGGSSVYGGSRHCEAATLAPLPRDTRLAASVVGRPGGGSTGSSALADLAADLAASLTAGLDADAGIGSDIAPAPGDTPAYPAVVDLGALCAADSGGDAGTLPIVTAVHDAARRFAARHARSASLTLLLPADDAPHAGAWQRGGERAAARMLVSTLACELAPRALRVNAIEVGTRIDATRLIPLLRYVAGARAQYLTGQTLRAVDARG